MDINRPGYCAMVEQEGYKMIQSKKQKIKLFYCHNCDSFQVKEAYCINCHAAMRPIKQRRIKDG